MQENRKGSKWKKWILAIGCSGFVCAAVIGSTTAYLTKVVGVAHNVFSPRKIVNIAVVESTPQDSHEMVTSEHGTKVVYQKLTEQNTQQAPISKEVWIQNLNHPSNRTDDVYIRARLVPIWRTSKAGNVAPIGTGIDTSNVRFVICPDDTHTPGHWKLAQDGYYYFTEKVSPAHQTDQLISGVYLSDGVIPSKEARLEVQVLADAVQATSEAVTEAWGTKTPIS
ncbi:MAG: hypothetical protein RR920_02520 [Lachnospiraceae bacterium]